MTRLGPTPAVRRMRPEEELQRNVTDLAVALGWDWAHWRPARTAHGWRTPVEGTIGAGFVDLLLVRKRDRRQLFAELKSNSGVVSPEQRWVLDILRSLETGPGACGEWPTGAHAGETRTTERRHECCPVWIDVAVWRPADWLSGAIEGVLR